MVNTPGRRLGAQAARRLAALGRAERGPGLTEPELDVLQERFGIVFAADHRAFLAAGLPTGPRWPDWRNGELGALRAWLARPVEDVLFAVAEAGYWHPGWRRRPPARDAALAEARARLATVPRLIPVRGHRYLPDGRAAAAGHPVLSVHGADVVPYGDDLLDYVEREFGAPTRPPAGAPATAAFWSDYLAWSNRPGG
ncbi:hypothetical protein RM844_00425 [Streptomyces sp. DSM 44915]|uniref:SMI1/KNR4 family protein n=1 Tax=Streptomyces chisholmiae TaxID=3075540 RepID=A0ABU2JJ52_9ACTN|nr:hypothetical protein [Streptomyces sp. DSM 44915]MDT0264748.1 hypothetical protein [Streptomyces sp. DSM 44915]